MWKQFIDFGRQLLSLTQNVEKSKEAVKELREERKEDRDALHDHDEKLEQMARAVQQVAFQMQRNHENEQHEREKMALRLEVLLLRSGNVLPAGDAADLELRREVERLRQANEALRSRIAELEQKPSDA